MHTWQRHTCCPSGEWLLNYLSGWVGGVGWLARWLAGWGGRVGGWQGVKHIGGLHLLCHCTC